MNKKLIKYYFLFIAIFIGYIMTVQIRANQGSYQEIITIPKLLEMRNDIENTKKETLRVADSIAEAKLKLHDYETNLNKTGNIYQNMQDELDAARNAADYENVEGPGILISMNDSTEAVKEGENPNWFVIHDADILEIVNELRAAGAEAISINDERVTARSNIRCGGPTINIDGKRHAVPFIIKAIGDPQKLEASVTAPSSYIDLMEYYKIRINVQKADNLTIEAYDMNYRLNYQKKAKDGE